MTEVEIREMSKHFGGVCALSSVDLDIEAGTVHALVGENGAGKSTLGKVIAGVIRSDSGTLRLRGDVVRFRSPRDALAAGVATISQELALVPLRSVLENVFLGDEDSRVGFVRRGSLLARYKELDERVGFGIPATVPVGALRWAEQQKVEILRAISRGAQTIIMDEPTSALTADEAKQLLKTVRELAGNGTTIIYISHFLEEVLSVADGVTAMRNGGIVETKDSAAWTLDSLVLAMLGRPLEGNFPEKHFPSPDSPTVFSVEGLRVQGVPDALDFAVRAGEIVGMAGLVGSGRSEVARAIFGADRRRAGSVKVNCREVRIRSPRDAIREGIAMLPESRKTQGLHMRASVIDNVLLPHISTLSRAGFVRTGEARREVAQIMQRVDVRAESPRSPLDTLSGGNQQKALFAKWLFRTPRFLIVDEPTRGVDVGAKRAIYQLLVDLAREGMGILMISSEMEEILHMSHRVLVMRDGHLAGEFEEGRATEEQIMHAAFGTGTEME